MGNKNEIKCSKHSFFSQIRNHIDPTNRKFAKLQKKKKTTKKNTHTQKHKTQRFPCLYEETIANKSNKNPIKFKPSHVCPSVIISPQLV